MQKRTFNGPGSIRFLKDLLTSDPHLFLRSYMHQYGSVTRLKLFKEIYLINHHDTAKEILKKAHKEVGKKNFIIDRMKKVFGNGIVISEDDLWLQERRILMPSFHKQKVHAYLNDIESTRRDFFDSWAISGEETIDLTPEIRLMIMNMMIRSLTGIVDSKLARELLELMEKGAVLISNSLPFNAPNWVPGSKITQLEKMNLELEQLIIRMLTDYDERIKNREAGMLSDLFYATDENGQSIGQQQMIDEIKSILLSGVFTTSDAILWTVSLIETHPMIKNELLSVLQTEKGDHILNNVINESTRLYPPVWSLWYGARMDIEIEEKVIPENAVIFINLYNVMRNPAVFKDADVFRPSRFDEAEFPADAFIPYGFGARKCIGANLASFIIPNVIRSLYSDYEIQSNLQLPLEAKIMITLTNTQDVKLNLKRKA